MELLEDFPFLLALRLTYLKFIDHLVVSSYSLPTALIES
jgi:hypothetical protein